MKNKFFATLVVLLAATASIFAQTINHGHGLQEYKLDNGLTVFLWEDKDATDVHGRVVCRAGAVDEPSDYSGLAHYLEHMLFKGTDKIGAINWEKEKPLYEQIIALYNEFNAETDENKRLDLIKKINEVSLEAAQYGATDDFSNLTESYGGDNLNAFTSYDLTAYFNTFPAGALEKWLEINSERLLNPVFRSFQAELENVYEEFNMYQDELGTHQRSFLFSNIYKGTPYERDVIGYQHHLKNPSLSKLIEFFQTWYVPNNMCLMLVGNFDAEAAKPLIAEKFGRLQPKEIPARAKFEDTKIVGNEKFKAKLGYSPMVYWVYPGVKKGSKDELALSVAFNLLNNGHNTGLLDKLMLDNTLSTAYVSLDSRREAGRIMVVGVPYYDVQQRTFETFGQTQRYITKEIDKLRNENTIPDWLFKSVINQLLQGYTTQFESTDAKVNMITYSYAYAEVLDVLELVSEYQPKVIALDVFFKTPSTDSAQVLNTLSTTPNLVLPRIIRRQADGQYQYTNFSFVEKYVDTHYGYVNLNASALNDVIRDFTPWQITANGDTLFHIATAMAKIADPDQYNKLQERNKGVETIKFSSIDIPIIPYEEILYGNDDEYLSRNLTNKAVIIGDTVDLHDMYTTPLKGLVPGVLIHAHSLHTILTASYTDSTPNWLNWLIAIIISILFLFANMVVKDLWSHIGNMVMRLLQVALMFTLVFVGAYWYNHHLQYLDFSPVIVMLGFCSLSADIYDGILAGVLQIKKFIQSH